MIDNSVLLNLGVALGIGLLVGAERERSKSNVPTSMVRQITR